LVASSEALRKLQGRKQPQLPQPGLLPMEPGIAASQVPAAAAARPRASCGQAGKRDFCVTF